MSWLDGVILGIIGLSAGISLIRGFFREVLSLAVWVLALWLGVRFAAPVAEMAGPLIESPTIRLGAAFILLFVGTLLIGALVNNAVAALVVRTGLSGTDRVLGVLFGAARGAVVVALAVLVLGLTPMSEERAWSESTLLPEIKPWICRAGVDAWLADLDWQPPIESEATEGLDGIPAYWAEYCAARQP